MEAIAHDFWSIPAEVLLDIFSLLSARSVLNFEATCKAHLRRFEEQAIYKRLACKLVNWGPEDVKEAEPADRPPINWRTEFTLSSVHINDIYNNELVPSKECNPLALELMPRVAPNHFRWEIKPETAPVEYTDFLFQSRSPIYPLPLGDFTVGYYEVNVMPAGKDTNDLSSISIGGALAEYMGLVGVGRNSFAYTERGQVQLECLLAPGEYPPLTAGDTVGFGIDFTKRSIFFTLNGQFICEKTHNYLDSKLLNLDTLHASISCGSGFELKANFGSKPFKFDILKYYQQRPVLATVRKLSFSITMLIHLRCYIEEEALGVIESGEFVWNGVVDCNHPIDWIPKMNPLWLRLLHYPNLPGEDDGINLIEFASCEIVTCYQDLLVQWKSDKLIQTFVRTITAQPASGNDTQKDFDNILNDLIRRASVAFSVSLGALVKHFATDIRRDFFSAQDDSPSWSAIALAFSLLGTLEVPLENFFCQAALACLNYRFQFGLEMPFGQEAAQLIATARDSTAGMRVQALRAQIFEKNERKKEEFARRDALLKEMYRYRLPQESLDKLLPGPPVRPPTQIDLEGARKNSLAMSLIIMDQYDTLDPATKAINIFETACLLPDFSLTEHVLESESEFVKLLKAQIQREISPEEVLEVLKEMKNMFKTANNTEALAYFYKLFNLPDEASRQDLLNKVDEELEKRTKAMQQQSSSTISSAAVLIGAGIGLLVGLGAIFALRWRRK